MSDPLLDEASNLPRRSVLKGGIALSAALLTGPPLTKATEYVMSEEVPHAPDPHGSPLGPILGHIDAITAMIWVRASGAGDLTLEIVEKDGQGRESHLVHAREENDLCVHWCLTSLKPGTAYEYSITDVDGRTITPPGISFTTAPDPQKPSRASFAISSCAKEDQGSRAVWNRMADEAVDAVILIGDTPYIDSTDLKVQTKRHREFAAVKEYQHLLSTRPCWWTWDDHDFATNDSNGLAKGKENSRTAYTRYRPQREYGDGNGGVYTSFRRGPIETFLLDTRWFSSAEPSFTDPAKKTLLGTKQWAWLKKNLLDSTACFKMLACGMIWDDKGGKESDHWGTYVHELEAIKTFIRENRITGVFLVGGDIHVSRVLRYDTKESVGYQLVQFIASPIHGSTIPSLNVYNPHLVRGAVEPNVFLRIDVDGTLPDPELKAYLINKNGDRVFSYSLKASELNPWR